MGSDSRSALVKKSKQKGLRKMNIATITTILELITAMITLLGVLITKKQHDTDQQASKAQTNQSSISNANVSGNITINQHNNMSGSFYNQETWKIRDNQYLKFLKIFFFVLVIASYFLVTHAIDATNIVSTNILTTLKITSRLLAIFNVGLLIAFFTFKTWKNSNDKDSGLAKYLHYFSRMIWSIALLSQILLAYNIITPFFQNNLIFYVLFIVINIIGSIMFSRITLAGTMFSLTSRNYLIIHLLYWASNIGTVFYYFYS